MIVCERFDTLSKSGSSSYIHVHELAHCST